MSRANFCILTNNPLAAEKYPGTAVFMESASVEGIFISARDKIHIGAKIINHPLAGSVKPNESPFKSLVLSLDLGPADMDSLALIEGALAVLKKLPQKNRRYGQRVLDDFMTIDMDLLDSAIKALPPQYHF